MIPKSGALVFVTKALQELIARWRRKRLLDLMGKLAWDSSYDYKAERTHD